MSLVDRVVRVCRLEKHFFPFPHYILKFKKKVFSWRYHFRTKASQERQFQWGETIICI